jgi:DNA-binding MarR family transcriptional regulator
MPAYTGNARHLPDALLVRRPAQGHSDGHPAYDDALRPVGIRITQFSVLAHLLKNGEVRVRDLGAGLMIEETTLTRSLRPLDQQGWVKLRAGDDRREKLVSITASGRELMKKAAPPWLDAQKQMNERVSATTWDAMFCALPKVAEAATN